MKCVVTTTMLAKLLRAPLAPAMARAASTLQPFHVAVPVHNLDEGACGHAAAAHSRRHS